MTGGTMHPIPEEWKNTGEKTIGFDLIEDGILFAAGYPAAVTLLAALHTSEGGWAQPFLLLAGLLLSTVCRRRIRVFGLYLLAELPLAAAIVVLSWQAGGVAAALIGAAGMLTAAGVGIHRFFNGFSKEDVRYDPEKAAAYRPYIGPAVPLGGTLVLFITNLVSLGLHQDRGWLCLSCLTVLLAGYTVYSRRRGEAALLAGGTPGSEAFRRLNRGLNALLAVLIGVGGALLTALYQAMGLAQLDRALVGWFTRPPQAAKDAVSAPSVSQAASSRAIRLPQNLPGGHSPALAALGGVIKVLALILSAAGILLCAAALAVAVARLLRTRRAGPGVRQARTSAVPIRVIRSPRSLFPAFGRITGTGNRIRIRRIYAKMVRKAIRTGIKIAPSDTPAQIAEKLGAQPPVMEATALYEKARYGADDCTREDVARMKHCLAER